MKTKSLPKTLLALCALSFALFGNVKQVDAAVTELPLDDNWGNTVYFTITDATNHYVEYVCPNQTNISWDGFEKPTGILDLPGTFDFMGVVYTATSIGNAAFNGCSGVYAVTIPSTVTHISSNAFNGTSLIQVNVYSNAIASDTYTSYYNFNTLFGGEVSGYTFGQGVTAIGPCALYSCDFLETVTIANTVTSIGYEAFQGCTYLESIVLPNSMTTIGDYAFSDCSHLTSVNIPPSVTSIGNSAFRNCNLLSRVNITDIAAWCAIDFGHNYGFYDSNPLSYAHHLYLNNTEITALTIPNTVTYIKAHAFYGCTAFTSVTIPASVTTIGIGAFTECTGLTRVTTPSLNAWLNIHFYSADANPLSYAHSLYVNNTKITTPNIPDGCQIIKPYAFSGADFTSVTVPSSLVNVGEGAFINCNSLTKVTVADLPSWCAIEFANAAANPLTYAHHLWTNGSMIASDGNWSTLQPLVPLIGSYALSGWTDLQNLTIEGYVDVVENSAFTGCTNLTSVTINDNLDAIASATYTSTNNLKTRFGSQVTSYTLGPHVTTIGDYAFYNCSGMTEVTFQGPVSSMGNDAFKGCTGLTRVNVNNLNAWCGIDFDYYDSNPLYYAHHLYHNNNLVTQLDNLDSPASIGAYAFSGCTDLTSVTIPSSVQSVGNHAFYGCTSLTTVTINSNAVASASYSYNSSSYSNDTFGSRFGNQVTSYILGPEVTAIGSKAFYNCTGMTEVTFQGPVSSMGENAFRGCTGLTRVNVSDLDAWCGIGFNDYNYNSNPLYYVHHLYCNGDLVTNLDNLSTATSIGAYAFYGCTDLTSVTIPSSVQSVWNHAFDGCTSLTSVTINSNAVASAEYGVSSNLNTRFGNQVTSCTFGPEVTAIGKFAFYYCTGMTEVTIPSSVQTIGADAFHGCTGFTSLTIPSSVQTIGADAFYGCSGITELYVGAMTPPTIVSSTFTNVSRSIPVYVPIGTGASYRAAEYWSLFNNIIESAAANTSIVEVPYEQTFDDDVVPEGWASYTGQLQESGNTYTATLTPSTNAWHFGQQNGVFDSHAYTVLGANNNEHKWLVSPLIILGNANDLQLSFDIGMSRQTGNQVPLTPGEQDNQKIYVFVSDDEGATWHMVNGWCGEMCGLPDLNALNPQGTTSYVNLSSYQNETIQVAFYVECTDGSDNVNNVHIDNVSIMSYDVSLPPTAVTVSEIAGHSAKVSWTPASPVQYKWDVLVAHVAFNPNTGNMEQLGYYDGVMEHVNGYRYKTITGLIPNYDSYKAWVRYNDGSVTSEWVASASFETDVICPMPSDITIVEHGLHSATITWTPGDENQTSWYIFVDNYHDMDGEELEEPSFTMNNLIPGENYDFYLIGYCGEDGESDRVNVDFTMSDYPSLTVNDGTATSYTAVINAYETDANYASTQFVIPANELTDMQYSTIQQLQFYSNVVNGTPWGNAQFRVYLKEVDFATYSQFCDDYFYPWSDMTSVYDGSLSISNGIMTITPWETNRFYYRGGDLLVGIYQYVAGSYGQAQWYGTVKSNPMSGYIMSQYDEDIVNCSTFAPKVTFSYEPDAFMPPTNLVVYVTAPDQVTLTWTPREGQTATEVQLYNEDMEPIGTPWTWSNGNVFGLGNLSPSTNYYVSLRGRFTVGSGTYYSAWTAPVAFTTPDYCDAPDNLQVNEVGPFSATITWDNTAAYDEVEYRALEIQWEEGFEGLSGDALPSGWTKFYNGNGQFSGGWWNYGSHNNIPPHSGERQMRSSGFSTYLSDNWLILPQMELGGVLTLWACTTQGTQQSFSVYVSTTGTNIADFGTTPVMTGSPSSYQEFIIDLSGFEGLGYVAIRHQDVPSGCTLVIDDVTYLNGGDWTSLGYVEGGQYDFEGLTPGTTYQARVRSMCEVDDASYPGYWTDPVSFSTPGNIVFEDDDVKDICVDYWDIDRDGELSYAEAEAVTSLIPPGSGDHGPFYSNPDVDKFNELQYFTNPELTTIPDYAFAGCVNLQEITLPPTITSIGYYAFGYSVDNQGYPVPCSSLHNIVIPPSVTTIGAYAFSQSGLTELILPPSVTSIGALAFGNCDNLEYVYLPASVTSIEGNAFTGTSIWTIEVDQENPVYDSRGGCNAIIQTDIDKLITGCKNTVIPDDVVSIGVSAFEYASGLTEITLPSSVESIGEYAFMNCTGLTTINAERPLPPTIYSNTFLNMVHSNVTVNVPCGALSDYKNAEIWSGLSFNYVDPCNIVFADANVKVICVDPATGWDTNGDGELSFAEAAAVTNIGTVFKSNNNITSFEELQYFTGLTSIEYQAFNGCRSLVSIVLPNSITSIGNSSFAGCNALSSIDIPSSVATIESGAFTSCYAFTEVTIPATVTNIGDNPFLSCRNLESITVEEGNPNYISPSGSNAIVRASDNTLISACKNTIIPDNIITIGKTAFAGITALTSVTIPSSVTRISNLAFWQCSNLTSITVLATDPPTLASNAFNLVPTGIPVYVPCESLETYQTYNNGQPWGGFTNYQESDVFICFADPAVKALCVDPATGWDTNGDGQLSYAEAAAVRTLNPSGASNSSVFKGNTTITSFDELQYFTGLSVIKLYAFQNCTALTSVTLPPTVTKIEYEAFMNCGLTGTLTLPEAVTTVEQDAFRECRGLTGLVIGSGVTSIGSLAFYNCTGLESITIEAVNPPALGTYNPFNRVPEDIPVYVPCGSVAAYQAAEGWSDFTNIIGDGCTKYYTLNDGWNWWVPLEGCTAAEFEDAIDSYLPVENSVVGDILIVSQNEGFARRVDGTWSGTLTNIVPGQMYKIKTNGGGHFLLTGDRPSTISVQLKEGYTWFGFYAPSDDPVAIGDAFNFEPTVGDQIMVLAIDGPRTFTYNGEDWGYGSSYLVSLYKGFGYIYHSVSGTKTLIMQQ